MTFEALPIMITSTAPCQPNLKKQLINQYCSKLYEIYGSTETGGIGLCCNLDEWFTPLPHWQYQSAYWILTIGTSEEEYKAPDEIEQHQDQRRFRPKGRRDLQVQVGGINISLAQVEKKLMAHPKITHCKVLKNYKDGRLKAFIVPHDPIVLSGINAEYFSEELYQWINQHLSTPEQPKSIKLGHSLPLSPHGKPVDWT